MKKYISPEYNNFAIELEDVLKTSLDDTTLPDETDDNWDKKDDGITNLKNVDW